MPNVLGARGLVLALLAVAFSAGLALAAPKFPPLTGRVVDDAHLLTQASVQKLDGELADLEAKTGHQVVVATVPDLQGLEIEEYGYQLGRTWQIGRKGQNDGAILLVAPAERKVRIEVGYGLEGVLTDALSNVIIQQAILPAFREKRMEQGVVQGAEALMQQLALPDDEARANVAKAAARPQQQESGGGFPVPMIVVILIVFWVLSAILRGGHRRRGVGRGGGMWWLLPLLLSTSGRGGGSGWGGGGGFGGGGGGFSGGGGSFGGGGSSGSW